MHRLALCSLVLSLGCADAEKDGHHHHDTDASHDTDTTPDTYEDGLAKSGGHVNVAITLDPAPAVGMHDVTLVVLHHGEPAEGFDVTLEATMPAHGHGTSDVVVTESSTPGTYTAEGLDLTMAGLWQLDVGVWKEDHGGDVTFRFEVP